MSKSPRSAIYSPQSTADSQKIKNCGLRSVVCGLLFIFCFQGCWAQNQAIAPNIQQEKTDDRFSWDFGRVTEGTVSKHNFVFKNETSSILTIKDVHTSCGCTVSDVKKKNLSPQETTFIEVQFNSKGYFGPVTQYIYVNTDNLDNPVVRYIIKADVIK